MTGKMTYAQQLAHPNWQRKRLQMLDGAAWSCQCCMTKDTTLHVHHKRYVKGRMAWEYEDDELQVLCKDCHTNEHGLKDLLERLLCQPEASLDLVVGLLAGYLDCQLALDAQLRQEALEASEPWFVAGQVASIIGMRGPHRIRDATEPLLDGCHSLNPAEEGAIHGFIAAAAFHD